MFSECSRWMIHFFFLFSLSHSRRGTVSQSVTSNIVNIDVGYCCCRGCVKNKHNGIVRRTHFDSCAHEMSTELMLIKYVLVLLPRFYYRCFCCCCCYGCGLASPLPHRFKIFITLCVCALCALCLIYSIEWHDFRYKHRPSTWTHSGGSRSLYLCMNNQIMCVWVISITILVVDSMKKTWPNVENVKMAKGNTRTHTGHRLGLILWYNRAERERERERTRASIYFYTIFQKNLALDFVIWVCSCGALSINEYQSLRSLSLDSNKKEILSSNTKAAERWIERHRMCISIKYILLCA